MKSPKICIVGAGIAGLSSANRLNKELRKLNIKNYKIDIFEAQETHGGRIKPLKQFADYDVELGAEEIHGSDNDLFNMIKQQGGKLFDFWGENKFYFYYKGKLLSEDECYKINPEVKTLMDFFESVKEKRIDIDSDMSVLEYTKKKFSLKPELNFILECFFGVETASDVDRLSMKGIYLNKI